MQTIQDEYAVLVDGNLIISQAYCPSQNWSELMIDSNLDLVNSLIQEITLTSNEKQYTQPINMIQYDSARYLRCTLIDYNMTPEDKVRLFFQSPRKILTYTDGVTESFDKAVFPINNYNLHDSGMNYAQLSIIRDNNVLKAFKFIINVEAAVIGVPISCKDKSNIEQLMIEMEKSVEEVKEIDQSIQDFFNNLDVVDGNAGW